MDDTRLGRHFRMGDTLVSSTFPEIARKMVPSSEQIVNATRWVTLIGDPASEVFGPLVPTSWIRTFLLTKALEDYRNANGDQVYFPSKTSQHIYGEAVDKTAGDLWGLFHFIRNRLPYWQLGIYLKKNGDPKHVHSAVQPLDRKLKQKVWTDEDGVFKLYKL